MKPTAPSETLLACLPPTPPVAYLFLVKGQKSNRSPGDLYADGFRKRAAACYFSMETSVALIIAKTLSPTLRFIRLTEPVVIIDVTSPAAVRMVSSETTLSETILSIVPGRRFRMLVLIFARKICERGGRKLNLSPSSGVFPRFGKMLRPSLPRARP